MQPIKKILCQQFTLKYITQAYQLLQVKPVLSSGSISLHYSEFVSNKHSNVVSVSSPSPVVDASIVKFSINLDKMILPDIR